MKLLKKYNLKTKQFTTKNGLKVLLIKRPEKYTSAFSLVINGGSIYENEKISGISHFFEHLFFTGTKSYPTEEKLRERSQEIGFSAGARTMQDFIEVYGTFPTEEWENSLKLLKETVFESLLDKFSINKEREVIYSEISMRKDNNSVLIWDQAIRMRFKDGNPLQMPVGGTEKSVGKLTREGIVKYYNEHCVPRNCVLIIGSNIPFERLEKFINEIFDNIEPGKKVKIPEITNDEMTGRRVKVLKKDTEHTYLFLSFPTKVEIDVYKAWKSGFLVVLLNELLNKWLRIERGIVYDIFCSRTNLSCDTGITYIQTSFHPRNSDIVINSIFKAINNLKNGKIDMKTLNRIRNTGNRTLPMAFDSISGAMSWIVNPFYYIGKIYSPEETIDARNKVSKKDLENEARKIFDLKKLNAIALGKLSEKDLDNAINQASDPG